MRQFQVNGAPTLEESLKLNPDLGESSVDHNGLTLASAASQVRMPATGTRAREALMGADAGHCVHVRRGRASTDPAARQILLLRREVKFLQKQWNSARRDTVCARVSAGVVLRGPPLARIYPLTVACRLPAASWP